MSTPRGFAGPEPAGDDPVREVRSASAAEPAERALRLRRVDLSLSTLADQVGACAAALRPLHALIEAHVLAAERLHGDDTTVPILAKGKTATGRIWVYVRDDRPFGGQGRRRRCSTPRAIARREHPERHLAAWSGILQADAYSGYNRLYRPIASRGGSSTALCWSHGAASSSNSPTSPPTRRRGKNAPPISPIALEAVKRIDAIFDIERDINGLSADERLRVRRETPLHWSRRWKCGCATERAKLSRHAAVAKAIDYMLTRWPAFTRFLEDGRICLTNNAAERALRGIALGRKSWLFAGSERGAERAAVMYTLDSDRKAQRRRSASLARRRSAPHRRHAANSTRRPAALELARNCAPVKGGLSAASKNSYDLPNEQRGGAPRRGLALGRSRWLFAGSERGVERAAVMYTLIQTATLNDVDPQAWLADVLRRIADTPQTRLSDLFSCNWRASTPLPRAA